MDVETSFIKSTQRSRPKNTRQQYRNYLEASLDEFSESQNIAVKTGGNKNGLVGAEATHVTSITTIINITILYEAGTSKDLMTNKLFIVGRSV